jgi:hypothetical protein
MTLSSRLEKIKNTIEIFSFLFFSQLKEWAKAATSHLEIYWEAKNTI